MASNYTASYNFQVSSLSTSSAGAVTGTSYSLPSGGAPAMISWTVTADGSALSVNLEGSNDDSVWATIDSQTNATGGTRVFGPTSSKFIRISQVSRTGGTATTAVLTTSKASVLGNVGTSPTGPVLFQDGTSAAPSISFASQTNMGFYKSAGNAIGYAVAGTQYAQFNGPSLSLLRDTSQLNFGVAADLVLTRDAANTLAQRNGANAQAFRIYNTFTDASNYERLRIVGQAGAAFDVVTEAAGTGTVRPLRLGSGAAQWTISTAGHFQAIADNTIDIGASGANRPRNLYIAGIYRGNALLMNGATGADSIYELAGGNILIDNPFALRAKDTGGTGFSMLGITGANNVQLQTPALGGNLNLIVNAAASISFATSATTRWNINSAGNILANTDNAVDIGASGANRVRNIFVASSIVFKTKAGTPTDADVQNPADGMMIIDTTALKIWVRMGGLWKQTAALT